MGKTVVKERSEQIRSQEKRGKELLTFSERLVRLRLKDSKQKAYLIPEG